VHPLAAGIDPSPELTGLASVTVYAVVLTLVFVESGLLVGFLLPGDTVLFAAGLLTAEEGSGVSLPLLAAGVFVAAVAGDSVGYAFGARLGRPWLTRRAEHRRLDPRHLQRAERLYARFGWFAVVVARWIPWLRTFTPILAGTVRMPYPTFLSANVVGALTWGVGLLVLGHVSAAHNGVRAASYAVAAVFVVASLAAATLGWERRRRSTPPPAG
jgi:membrane-associated protein